MFKTFVVIITLIILFVVWRMIAFSINTQKRDNEITRRLERLINLLQSSEQIPQSMIEDLAKDPLVRRDLYKLLSYHKKEDLFPEKFSTDVSLAESALVRYLLHANELGSVPETIVYVREVKEKENVYYIFKYKPVNDNKWYVGVAGSTVFSSGHEYSEQAIENELNTIRKNTKY